QVIFLTAHDEHAVRAFELEARDYLLKPYRAERLRQALERARARIPEPAWPEQILVDTGVRQVMVACATMVRVRAAGNYIEIHAGKRPLLTRMTLDAVQAQLDPAAFVRLNRSCLVRVDAIAEMQRSGHGEMRVRMRDGTEVIWTRRFRRAQGPLAPALDRLIPKA
ncbi:MAG: LytR/AlgR family response regulator transcription factor, partial [Terriglobales bacterium]